MLTYGGVDGIKNYYALSWYLDHNKSWTTFEGMNHPFGDLTIYTDGHPFLAWCFRAIEVQGADAVGLLNVLILLSLLPAVWFTWSTLKRLRVESTPAAFLALVICVSMPQWDRLGGHFSLSHLWAIPLMVWLLLRTLQSPRQDVWSIAYSAFSLVLYFFHPYLGLMSSGLALGTSLFAIVGQTVTPALIRKTSGVILGAIAPVTLFQGLIFAMDSHVNRPTDPAGFWVNHSSLTAWLVPHHGPLAPWLQDTLNMGNVPWEVQAYVGFAPAVLVFIWAYSKLRHRNWSRSLPHEFSAIAFAGALLGIFALGWIFKALPVVVEWVTPLKNFRVLGRFAWPWTYVMSLSLLAWGWHQSRSVPWRRVCFAMLVILGLAESTHWHKQLSSYARGQTNTFAKEHAKAHQTLALLAENQGCSAILPLPYFHKGSEMWDTPADEHLVATTLTASFHLGLPTLASVMSRTSISETVQQLTLRSPFPYKKHGIQDLTEGGRLLVVCRPETLGEGEAWLWDQCTERRQLFDWWWGILDPSKLANQPLLERDKPNVGPSEPGVFQKLSDEIEGEEMQEYTVLWEFGPGDLVLNQELECSFWFTQNQANRPEEAFFVAVVTPEEKSWQSFNTLNRSCHFSGDSIRFSAHFTPRDSTSAHRFVIRRPKKELENVTIRHLLLRPTTVNVIDTLPSGLYSVNNHIACSHLLPLSP